MSPFQPTLRSRTQRDLGEPGLIPEAGLSLTFSGAYPNCRPLGIWDARYPAGEAGVFYCKRDRPTVPASVPLRAEEVTQ